MLGGTGFSFPSPCAAVRGYVSALSHFGGKGLQDSIYHDGPSYWLRDRSLDMLHLEQFLRNHLVLRGGTKRIMLKAALVL